MGTAFDVLRSGNNNYHTASSAAGGGATTAVGVAQSLLQGADGAFTYEALVQFRNGAAGSAGNLAFYWTRMDAGAPVANLLGTATLASNLPARSGSQRLDAVAVDQPIGQDRAFRLPRRVRKGFDDVRRDLRQPDVVLRDRGLRRGRIA